MAESTDIHTVLGTNLDEDLIGSGGADQIYGFNGRDRIYAMAGDDILYGGAGNDLLDGGTGSDVMYGGSGDDIYKVDDHGDIVSEQTSAGVDDGGTDYVQTTISYTLPQFVERMEMLGSGNIDGAGNALNNTLKGNSGDNVLMGFGGVDTLYGGDGRDILIGGLNTDYLYGGAGADIFVLQLGMGAPDKIYDFESIDRIGIYADAFGLSEGNGLTGGGLDPGWFTAGTSATATGHGQFVYNSVSLSLQWDTDGVGGAAATTLVTFSAGTVVTADQFHVFADLPAPTGQAPDLQPGSDSGASSTDDVTNATAPVFHVALDASVASGDQVELLLGGASLGTPLVATVGATNLGNGYVTFTVPEGGLGGDGMKSLTARLTDVAGNSTETAATSVTLDTSAPAAPSVPALTDASDTGTSQSDEVTADTTPDFTGTAEANSLVTLFSQGGAIGSTTTDGTGNWTFTWATDADTGVSPLADGSYDITATATDAAGNISGTSTGLAITIETTLKLDLDSGGGDNGYATTFHENGAAVAIAGPALISDATSADLTSATITLTNPQMNDTLAVGRGLAPGITVDPSSTATQIVLTGTATLADYQAALALVTFSNTSDLPPTIDRLIDVTVTDGTLVSNTAVTAVTIDPAPDAANDTASTTFDTAVTLSALTGNDDIGDGSAVINTFAAASNQGGTITSNANGDLVYTPASGFTGTDSFTYTIAETDGDSSTATVTVTVSPGNQAPLITTSAIVDAIDSRATVIDIQATDDRDSEGKGLAYTLTGGADVGLFAINGASGVLSFKTAPVYTSPQDANHDNIYDVQVTVTDSGGLTTSQDLAIPVVPAPQFNAILGTSAGETLIGHALRDAMYGYGGNDQLYGQGEDDLLYGGTGNDVVDGGTGADVMYGGAGDDLYRVDNPADVVSEQTVAGVDDGGTDTVESKITYALPSFVEKLSLTGTAAINGTGNDLANRLTGNDAANVLSGGAGYDVIYGKGGDDILIGGAGTDELYAGPGSDTFVFGLPDASSPDKIKDFSATDKDHIGIYASDYGLSLGNGLLNNGAGKPVLDPAYFASVAGGASSVQGTASGHGQFVFSYTASTHTLMWDADGAGPAKGIALATVNLDAFLSASDVLVFSAPPTVSVNSWGDPVLQRPGEQVPFTFDLSAPWNADAILTYSTVDGTAVAGEDFSGVSHGQVVIRAGSTSATVLIDVLDENAGSPIKSLALDLESAAGAGSGAAFSIVDNRATGSIASPPPSVVAITDLTPIGSGDPFGLAYVPGLDTLFMVDPQELTRVDTMFALNLDGTLQSGGVSSLGFSWKPAGLAYDPSSDRLYVADDDSLEIQWVDPANPTVMLGKFSAVMGISTKGDTEDVAVNPLNGHVFICNGGDFGEPKIIETDATGSQIYRTIDLKAAVVGHPIGSPEALAYDPTNDVFFVAGNNFDIKVVNWSGTVLDDITLLQDYRNPAGNIGTEIQGLTFAPSSDPYDDPAKLNLYVTDAGLLNTEGDGRLIEIDLHGGFLTA